MFMGEPDMRDRGEFLVTQPCRRKKAPAIVERSPFEPGVAEQADLPRFNNKGSMIDPHDSHSSPYEAQSNSVLLLLLLCENLFKPPQKFASSPSCAVIVRYVRSTQFVEFQRPAFVLIVEFLQF